MAKWTGAAGLRPGRLRHFDAMHARRWVCKRAHDLGWTAEVFGEIDRYRESSGRTDHRVERIGKKYQWIALEHLLARLADNAMFIGQSWNNPQPFDGSWEVQRRDIIPPVLTERTKHEAWRNRDKTWWMPIQVSLKPMSPSGRLRWLESFEDLLNDTSLIDVVEPKTQRRWLVLNEVSSWHQWAVRDGDRQLDRTMWFRLQSVLVRKEDRDKVIGALSEDMITDEHDFPTAEMPSDGFLGEYPWHPAYRHFEEWTEASASKMPVRSQPTVARYASEISGYDFSIEESFHLELPGIGLMKGLDLHLSNGRDMEYADGQGKTIVFDPSVRQPGPSATLVDRDAFLAFLERDGLTCVWAIGGLKRVSGGKRYGKGFGGERLFSSIYWPTKSGFQRHDKSEYRRPSADQLKALFEEEGAEVPVPPLVASSASNTSFTNVRKVKVREKKLTKKGGKIKRKVIVSKAGKQKKKLRKVKKRK